MIKDKIQKLYDQRILWQMSAAERMTLNYIVDRMEVRNTVIEVGSYKGGCTKFLSEKFNKVISIDIDHSEIVDLVSYNNVKWMTGFSSEMIPIALRENKEVHLIIIDGDHNYNSVLSDISMCMNFNRYTKPIILIHDAAYEPTHKAIMDVKRNSNEDYFIDEKFVPGEPFNGGMIGGLGLIYKL